MNHKEAFDLFVIYYFTGVHHYADGEFDNKEFSLNLKNPLKDTLEVGKSFFTDIYISIKEGTKKNFTENQCNTIKGLYQKAVEYGKVDHADADEEENSKDIAAFQSYYNRIPHILSEIGIESDTDSEKGISVLDRAPEIIGTILDNLNKKEELELYEIYHLIKKYYPDIELTDSASEILYANENKFTKEIVSFPIDQIHETKIKTDYFKKIKQALYSSNNAVIIQGPIGTGKFTIAIEYARKNQKYDKIVCLKWDVDFDHSIAHISTSDDCFNEKESENDRINRKNEIWKNNAGTTILMIICDVPSKSVCYMRCICTMKKQFLNLRKCSLL